MCRRHTNFAEALFFHMIPEMGLTQLEKRHEVGLTINRLPAGVLDTLALKKKLPEACAPI